MGKMRRRNKKDLQRSNGVNVLMTHAQGYSGGVQVMFNLYKELKKYKNTHNNYFLCYFGKENIAKKKGVYDNKTIFINKGLVNPLLLLDLLKVIKNNKIDIIYTHSPAAHFIFAFLNVFLRRKLIVHLHGDFKNDVKGYGGNNFLKQKIRKILFKISVNKFITVSDFTKKNALNIFPFADKKIKVILNGVEDKSKKGIDPDYIKNIFSKYNIGKNDFVVLNIGTLSNRKNQIDIIKLAKKINEEGLFFKIFIIGTGEKKSELEEEIYRNNLNNNVFLVGEVSHDNIHNWYKICDLYISTSLAEPFGLTIIESMSCGIPSLSYRVGGIPEIINNDKLLCEARNVKDLFNKFKYLYKHKKERVEISNNLKIEFQKKYTLRRQKEEIVKILNSL